MNTPPTYWGEDFGLTSRVGPGSLAAQQCPRWRDSPYEVHWLPWNHTCTCNSSSLFCTKGLKICTPFEPVISLLGTPKSNPRPPGTACLSFPSISHSFSLWPLHSLRTLHSHPGFLSILAIEMRMFPARLPRFCSSSRHSQNTASSSKPFSTTAGSVSTVCWVSYMHDLSEFPDHNLLGGRRAESTSSFSSSFSPAGRMQYKQQDTLGKRRFFQCL